MDAGPPLNVNRLQERMQLMLQDPVIERLSGELGPGVGRGEAVLRVAGELHDVEGVHHRDRVRQLLRGGGLEAGEPSIATTSTPSRHSCGRSAAARTPTRAPGLRR